jgi:hypothetical protein
MTIIEGKAGLNFSPPILRFSIVPKHFESNMLLECANEDARATGGKISFRVAMETMGLFPIVEPRLKIYLGNSGMPGAVVLSATNENLLIHLQLLAYLVTEHCAAPASLLQVAFGFRRPGRIEEHS